MMCPSPQHQKFQLLSQIGFKCEFLQPYEQWWCRFKDTTISIWSYTLTIIKPQPSSVNMGLVIRRKGFFFFFFFTWGVVVPAYVAESGRRTCLQMDCEDSGAVKGRRRSLNWLRVSLLTLEKLSQNSRFHILSKTLEADFNARLKLTKTTKCSVFCKPFYCAIIDVQKLYIFKVYKSDIGDKYSFVKI